MYRLPSETTRTSTCFPYQTLFRSPTSLFGCRRRCEVLLALILKAVEKQGKFAAYLLRQALRIGGKSYAGNLPLCERPVRLLVDRTLAPKIQQRFGGRIKAMVSGGAPLTPDIGIFFHSLEIGRAHV